MGRSRKSDRYPEIIHTRVSTRVKTQVQDKAKEAGMTPATWVRHTIHKALGLVKE
jgi:antitoxin component of RelBE/YafQ-DinJ toxin-antitoxin module